MRRLAFPIVSIVILLGASLLVSQQFLTQNNDPKECYVGVTFCGNTAAEAKLLIDRVKNFTNLFVLQSGPVSKNESAINEICDYATEAGLNIVVYFGDLDPYWLRQKDLMWRVSWLPMAKQRWGDKFLGVYYYDEPGGLWLDFGNWSSYLQLASNFTYDDVAERYITTTQGDEGYDILRTYDIPAYASDYVLYWFDYLMGYDVMWAQLGWNHTIEQDIALLRGAANLQNKSWGTIITWKYLHPPYLDTAANIYDQMVLSYKAGAEYVVIFNYAENMTSYYGTLHEEHFLDLERFWNDVVQNPEAVQGSTKAEAVLVLPKNYGWGMRTQDDKIWAFWEADTNSEQSGQSHTNSSHSMVQP